MSFLETKLEKIKNKKGKDLYNHLCNVFSKITLDNPKNAYDVFEDYSHHIQLINYDFQNHDSITDEQCKKPVDEEQSELYKEFLTKSSKLLEKLTQEGEDAAEVPAIGFVPNFMEEARWFEWAGVGFGEEESYRIFKSLSALSFKKTAVNVKLWGKILCSGKDYYVAVGEFPVAEQEGLGADVELPGQPGVNKFTFYVTNDLGEEWTPLPIVKPQQIVIARQIKYIFTGDLNRKITTNPHFDGTEAELLKCQIVRIYHTTTVIPKGLFEVAEEKTEIQEIVPDENYKPTTYDQLTNPENWQHEPMRILKGGRTKHYIPAELPEGVDPEEFQKQIESKEPYDRRLKPLNEDEPPVSYKNAWKLSLFSDQSNYTGKENLPVNNGVISIKNIYWPGAITVYHKGKTSSLYIGQGFKISNELFFPSQPEIVLEEQSNMEEEAELNIAQKVEEVQEGEQNAEENQE